MSLITFDFIIFRIVFPICLFLAAIVRNNAYSFVYLVLLFVCPLLRREETSRHNRGIKVFLSFVVVLSCLFILSHFTTHFYLVMSPNVQRFTNCSSESLILSQIGIQQLTGIASYRIARMVIPDPFMLVVSVLLLIYYIRRGKLISQQDKQISDGSERVDQSSTKNKILDERTEIWKAWAVENLCIFNSVLILCFSAIVSPSALSAVYLLFFLGICTFWACHQKVDSSNFGYVRLFLLVYSAGHISLYYLYQFDFFQESLPVNSRIARLLGLYYIYQKKCDNPGELFIVYDSYKEIFAPFVTLILYYILAIETRRWLDITKQRNALRALIASKLTKSSREDYKSNQQEDVMLISSNEDEDSMHYNTIRAPLAIIRDEDINKKSSDSMATRRLSSQKTDDFLSHDSQGQKDKGLIRRNSTIDWGDTSLFRKAFYSGIFNPNHLFPLYKLRQSKIKHRPFMLSVWYSCVRNSYATSFCAMMAWSVTFRNWFSFVLILLACLLWLLPNSRRAVLYCSPVIVFYSILLILYQYIVCIDVTNEQILKNQTGQVTYKLDDFGLECKPFPFVALIIQILFLCIFWLTLKLFMMEIKGNTDSISSEEEVKTEQEYLNSHMNTPNSEAATSGSLSLPTDPTINECLKPTWLGFTSSFGNKDHPAFTWLSCSIHRFCIEYWLAFCCLMLLIVSVLLPVVYVRIVYMIMLIYFLLIYQLSYRIWRKQMLFFWWMCITYSTLVLLIVYTYQFDVFKKIWSKVFRLNETNETIDKIGLVQKENDATALFTRLLTPSVFIVSMILQVHYFHAEFMEITAKNYNPRENETPHSYAASVSTNEDSDFNTYVRQLMISIKYRLIRSYYTLKNPAWRFLEVHWMKFLSIYVMAVITNDVSTINMVPLILILICLPFPYLHSACCTILFLFSGIQTTSQMILQLMANETIPVCPIASNATINLENLDPKNLLQWFGLKKETNYSIYITKMILLMLGSVFYHVIYYRQRWYHMRVDDIAEGIIFQKINIETVGKDMKNIIKFAFNYAFYIYGLEASYCVIVITATLRSDSISLIYLLFLLIFLFSSRNFASKLWPFYLFVLSLMLPIQYAACIGLKPFCIHYAWENGNKQLLEWLFLPTNENSPDARKLMADFFQFLFVTMQYRIFRLEKDPSYGGGCNKPILMNIPPKNADNDFISSKTAYIDYIMHAVFYWSYWLSLAIILLSGVMWITLFCLGYMVVAFVFLWLGQNILCRRRKKLLISWNCVLAYNFIVIFLKCSFQLLGCVYRDHNKYLLVYQMFGVQCLNPMNWNKFDENPSADQSVQSGLHLDVFCFLVILFQRKIFTMAAFSSVVFDLGIQTSFASWGAKFINKMLMERIRTQDREEEELFKKLQDKIDRIYRRFDDSSSKKTKLNEHYMMLRSGDYSQFRGEPEDEDETFVHDLDIPPIRKRYNQKINKNCSNIETEEEKKKKLEPSLTIDNQLFDKLARSVNEDERQMAKVIANFTDPFELREISKGSSNGNKKKGHTRVRSEPNGNEIYKDINDGFRTDQTSSAQSTVGVATASNTPKHGQSNDPLSNSSTLRPTSEVISEKSDPANRADTTPGHRRIASYGANFGEKAASDGEDEARATLRVNTDLVKMDRATIKSQSFSPNNLNAKKVRGSSSCEINATNLPEEFDQSLIKLHLLNETNEPTYPEVDVDDPTGSQPEMIRLLEKFFEMGPRKTIDDYKKGILSSHHSNTSIHITQTTPNTRPRELSHLKVDSKSKRMLERSKRAQSVQQVSLSFDDFRRNESRVTSFQRRTMAYETLTDMREENKKFYIDEETGEFFFDPNDTRNDSGLFPSAKRVLTSLKKKLNASPSIDSIELAEIRKPFNSNNEEQDEDRTLNQPQKKPSKPRKYSIYLPKQVTSISEDNEDNLSGQNYDPLNNEDRERLNSNENNFPVLEDFPFKKEVHFHEEDSDKTSTSQQEVQTSVLKEKTKHGKNETLWSRIRSFSELMKILFISAIKSLIRVMNLYTKDYRCMRKYLDKHKRISKRELLRHSFDKPDEDKEQLDIEMLSVISDNEASICQQNPSEKILADEKKGEEFMRSRSMIFLFFMAMGNLAVYYSDSICYIIMISNTIKNPSLLTLPFPLLVFLWALLCVPRPSKTFWIFIITYTEIMIIVKYIFQFEFFTFNKLDGVDSNEINHPYWLPRLFGIVKKNDYATFDLVQLIFVFLHRAYLKTNGLWRDHSETAEDLERAAKTSKNKSINTDSNNQFDKNSSEVDLEEFEQRSSITTFLRYINIAAKVRKFYLKMTDTRYNIKVDVYKYMFLCEFISFIIIIFGYKGFSYSTGIDDLNAFEFLKTNKIPLPFFLTGVTQSLFIIIDRGLFLRKNVLGKFIFQIIHVLLIHIWLFIILPYMTMTNFDKNKIPIVLYIIKCVYFALSAYQIRSNYPKRILGNFLAKNFDYVNLVLFKVYMNIPFLYELRSVMDWMWTKSTFSLYHWMQFEDIYAKLFVNKCWRRSECHYPTPRGKNRKMAIKSYVGIQIVSYFLLCLWAPIFLMLLLESTFVVNVPYSCQVSYSINGYSPIYKYTARSQSMKSFSAEQREHLLECFEKNRRVAAFMRKFQAEDIVHLQPSQTTDDYWTISSPALERLQAKINDSQSVPEIYLNFLMSCQRTHKETDSTILTVEQNLTRVITLEERNNLSFVLSELPNQNFVHFKDAYPRIILAGNGFLSIPFPNEKKLLGNITATMHSSNKLKDLTYWDVVQRITKPFCPKALPNSNGLLDILVFNQRIYDNPIAKYISSKGIIGIYAAYIFFAHRILRMLFHNLSYNIRLEELPYLDRVLNMCHEIYLVREFQELRLEEQLYSRLLFLYRSSEMMIKWTRHPQYLVETFSDPPQRPDQCQESENEIDNDKDCETRKRR